MRCHFQNKPSACTIHILTLISGFLYFSISGLPLYSSLLNSPYTWESNLAFNIYGCLRRNLWMSPRTFYDSNDTILGEPLTFSNFGRKFRFLRGGAIVGSNSNTSRTSGGQGKEEGAPLKWVPTGMVSNKMGAVLTFWGFQGCLCLFWVLSFKNFWKIWKRSNVLALFSVILWMMMIGGGR